MNLQVLVSTMHQKDHSILDKMNIQSDAIIINQCDRNEVEEFEYKGHHIKFYSFNERGVGLSRNTALMRATADIVLFADDDVTYVDNYSEIIISAFNKQNKAKVIAFNVPSTNHERPTYYNAKNEFIPFWRCLKYGTFTIAARREELISSNIYFSQLFGGGAKYSSGEDSLFLADCIRNGLSMYSNTSVIGTVTHTDSTWFKGYDDKFFIDKGAFFACLSRKFYFFYCIQFAVRKYKVFKDYKSFTQLLKLLLEGAYKFGA